MTARVRRFDDRVLFEEAFADIRGVLEVVATVLAEQPALRSWQLFCRRDDRSIAPVNARGQSSRDPIDNRECEKSTQKSWTHKMGIEAIRRGGISLKRTSGVRRGRVAGPKYDMFGNVIGWS
jgi:hypothetical protein